MKEFEEGLFLNEQLTGKGSVDKGSYKSEVFTKMAIARCCKEIYYFRDRAYSNISVISSTICLVEQNTYNSTNGC